MSKRDYFKGYYFKCCTDKETVAFIPAYHSNNGITTASLQIITDHAAFHLPFRTMECQEKPLSAKLGNCSFSKDGIILNAQSNHSLFHGTLRFQPLSPIRYDIMGPFSLVPFMQCRHSVFSMTHKINGQITLDGQPFHFHNGTGYIEGDRGTSFPKRYIWTQCLFQNNSLMLSVADIPFCGFHFTGIIGIVLLNGTEYRIATYLGAHITQISENTVTVKQGNYTLTATLRQKNAWPLLAPTNGDMCRTIHESASCKAFYRFCFKSTVLCEFESDRASFEFEYSKN